MFVILKPDDYDRWLDPDINDKQKLLVLLKPWAGALDIRRVSKRVNNPKNDDESVLTST